MDTSIKINPSGAAALLPLRQLLVVQKLEFLQMEGDPGANMEYGGIIHKALEHLQIPWVGGRLLGSEASEILCLARYHHDQDMGKKMNEDGK